MDEIKIESNESAERKKPVQPPPDYTSRGMKMKLWTLVATLLFVLLMMNEARKPENWRWMGFDENGKQKKKVEEKKFIFEEAQYDTQDSDSNLNASQETPKDPESDSRTNANSNSEDQEVPDNSIDDGDVSLTQPEFWKLLYRQLELSEQRELFSILRELRERSLPGDSKPKRTLVVEKMDGFVKVRLTEMLNELSLIKEGLPKRESLNSNLQKLQNQWEQQLKPVLAGEPIRDNVQRGTVHSLQSILDQAAYAAVTDYSSPTKASDGPAWLRTWEKILFSTESGPVSEVKPIQLMSDSEFFRGKPVSIGGQLRGIEVIPSKDNPVGTSQFYSIWISPNETASLPFNVFVTELPEGVELSEGRYTAFEDLHVSITGCFFKVRTYKDAGGSISDTPLILARSFEVSEAPPVAAVPNTARNSWTPSRTTLVIFFVGMPLLAAAIAFIIFRGTMSRRMKTGATMSSKINHSLSELAEDSSVETVQEKLMRMENEGVSR